MHAGARIVWVVAGALALAACGDDDDNGSAAPAPSGLPAEFQGTWINCFDNGDGTSDRSTLVVNGSAFTANLARHAGAGCAGAATPAFSDTGTVNAGAPVDAAFAGTTVKAVPLDVTSQANGAFFDLGFVDTTATPDVLYLGDISGANDGTTRERRPTALDTSTPFLKQ